MTDLRTISLKHWVDYSIYLCIFNNLPCLKYEFDFKPTNRHQDRRTLPYDVLHVLVGDLDEEWVVIIRAGTEGRAREESGGCRVRPGRSYLCLPPSLNAAALRRVGNERERFIGSNSSRGERERGWMFGGEKTVAHRRLILILQLMLSAIMEAGSIGEQPW